MLLAGFNLLLIAGAGTSGIGAGTGVAGTGATGGVVGTGGTAAISSFSLVFFRTRQDNPPFFQRLQPLHAKNAPVPALLQATSRSL